MTDMQNGGSRRSRLSELIKAHAEELAYTEECLSSGDGYECERYGREQGRSILSERRLVLVDTLHCLKEAESLL